MLYYKLDVCATLKAMKRVSPDKLDAICDLLDMQQGDIIGFKRGKEDV